MNGYPADKLDEALDGVKVVVIPAGVPRKVSDIFSVLRFKYGGLIKCPSQLLSKHLLEDGLIYYAVIFASNLVSSLPIVGFKQ